VVGDAAPAESDPTCSQDEAETEATLPTEEEMSALREDLAAASAALEAAESQAAESKDKMLRALAEAENTRAIARRDVDNNRKFAIQKFALDVLDVADNMSRAADSVPECYREPSDGAGADAESCKALVDLYKGVNMTEAAMQSILGRYDITKFEPIGEKVDPNLHDVKVSMPDPEKESGTVGLVIRPGYMISDRVLRPAEVGSVA
jgi:molecular chaperone GrpE